MSDNLDVFAPVHDALASFQGYGLDYLSVSVIGSADAMELSLRPIHPKPQVTSLSATSTTSPCTGCPTKTSTSSTSKRRR
ncbi:hypothetical protein ACFFX1_14705 [Dactylosporangium sucinum]|uniref:hypothetical protein n=1 Tax=Dactylosporangium sucinum TaxID=1424081 RepID=UPI00167CCA2D|nr:hypothetical protein [Dactylosporangium sucinum]